MQAGSNPSVALRSAAAGRACEALAAYAATRAQTARLAAPLSAEDCALQSMPDASPTKWHLGHTSWFFETFVLEPGLPDYRPYRTEFRTLFNSYYVAVGPRHPRPERGLLSRPSLAETLAYRASVDERMTALFERHPDIAGRYADLIELGLNHEQQHQELLLTDIKHLLSRNPLYPAYMDAAREGAGGGCASAPGRWRRFPEGVRALGHAGEGFSFDNELPRHRVYLGDFELAGQLSTNAEYVAFMDDGGYERPELWLAEGWDVKCAQVWCAPLYWVKQAPGWAQFTLGGLRPLQPAEPVVHLSCYEADAFARWSGARLPTEFEWEVAAAEQPLAGNFLESGLLHPSGQAGPGERGFFGDCWIWTSSSYSPYPGYRPAAGAVGEYNGKFMVNQYVLRGGSCATPRSHIRASYRNFFPAPARWQFSGVRLARESAG